MTDIKLFFRRIALRILLMTTAECYIWDTVYFKYENGLWNCGTEVYCNNTKMLQLMEFRKVSFKL